MPWNGTTVRASGFTVTAQVWNDEIVENLAFIEEVAYVEFTSNVSVTGTTAVQIVSAGAIVLEAVPHLIEFSCVRVTTGAAGTVDVNLRDGTTDLGKLFFALAANTTERTVYAARRLTPTAASHTYNIAATNGASQTTTVGAGAGGAANEMPGFIRISRIPT